MMINNKYNVEPTPVRLYLAYPNKTIIGEVPEAYNIKRNISLGNVSTLSFQIPYQLRQLDQIVDNPNIVKSKTKYLVKFVHGSESEWFIIKSPLLYSFQLIG